MALLPVALGLTSPDFVGVVAEDLARGARLLLVLESQFQVENGLRNILQALEPSNPADRFWRIVRDVLSHCGLPDPDAGGAIMLVPAAIRNSLHANGVHTQASQTTTVDGVTYRFEQGRPVTCAKLEYILHALGGSLGVIREILASAPVRALMNIDDAFVQSKRTSDPQSPQRPGEGPDEDLYLARLALLRAAEGGAGIEDVADDNRHLSPAQVGPAVYADALRHHEAQLRALGHAEMRDHELAHRKALLDLRDQALKEEADRLAQDWETFTRDVREVREDLRELTEYWQSQLRSSLSDQRAVSRQDDSARSPS